MTLTQLTAMKAWHVAHRQASPLEHHACDLVLTFWLVGWAGWPGAVLLDQPWAVLLCVLMWFEPDAYLRWRARLHRQGRLRCDWLDAVLPPRPPSHPA